MKWQRLKETLGEILTNDVQLVTFSQAEWMSMERAPYLTRAKYSDTKLNFLLKEQQDDVLLLAIEKEGVHQRELALIQVLIEMNLQQIEPPSVRLSEEEQRMEQLQYWIQSNLKREIWGASLPDHLVQLLQLDRAQLAILLHGVDAKVKNPPNNELKDLLDSFFDTKTTFVPLKEDEWLILAPEHLLQQTTSDEDASEESKEELLYSLGNGLYEVMASEGIGESHIALQAEIWPAKDLLRTIMQLRNTIALGRAYTHGENIHLPNQLILEELIDQLELEVKQDFVRRIFNLTDRGLDTESIQTLEHFFAMNCNVSETAKALYIHRNTLLYRLDKFKQETEFDVRKFDQAVLVKIALQLYKVTKRS